MSSATEIASISSGRWLTLKSCSRPKIEISIIEQFLLLSLLSKSRLLQMPHIDWLIYWGWTPFLTISQSYHSGQFTYTRFSWFSHTSTPHNNLPKQLAAFPKRLSPLVEDEWRMSHRHLSNSGKKVGRAGIRIRGHRKHLYEGKD